MEQGLPVSRRMDDQDVEQWWAAATLRVATAKELAAREPSNAEAQAALDRATAELAAAVAARARRQSQR